MQKQEARELSEHTSSTHLQLFSHSHKVNIFVSVLLLTFFILVQRPKLIAHMRVTCDGRKKCERETIRLAAGETDFIVAHTIMTHHARKRISQRGLSMKDTRASVVREGNVVITVMPNKTECIGERFMAIVLRDLEWTGKHRGYLVRNSKTHSKALMQVSLKGWH
jgi:hypothetical protein